MGLVAPRHVGSSQTRDRSPVPCIAGWFLTTWPPGITPSATQTTFSPKNVRRVVGVGKGGRRRREIHQREEVPGILWGEATRIPRGTSLVVQCSCNVLTLD